MDAKRLRLAKWKQAKQAKETAQAPQGLPELQSQSKVPAIQLSFAGLKSRNKDRKRVMFEAAEEGNFDASRSRDNIVSSHSISTVDSIPKQSIDDVLGSLDTPHSDRAFVVEDLTDGSDDEVLVPRKRPRVQKSKLATVVADHSDEPFEKVLFHASSDDATDAAEVYRTRNGIKVDGASIDPITQWHSAGLPLPLLHAVESQGFAAPTPIQAQSLPIVMSGFDLVGIAPTSSGKTIAFLLPLCRHVAANRDQHRRMSKGPYALVLAPTRELCQQIYREVEGLAGALLYRALGCYGGTDISYQISELINGRCDILVATPGRLIDLLAANHGRVLSLRGVTFLVVDETDRMFDLGFGPQVRTIVGALRPDRQTVVFSATISTSMESLVSRILTNPVKVVMGREARVPPQIVQEVELIVDPQSKLKALLTALSSLSEGELTLVFVETQERADLVALQLIAKGFKCQALHGGMDQEDRAATIAEFRSGMVPILVATSIAARGLDVRNLKLVVNFDAASHLEDYVHRAGRTGRAGTSGRCLTLLEENQIRHAHELARLFDVPPAVKKMAEEYNQTANSAAASRLGFGGHGLANLEKKRSFKKTVEQDAYDPRETPGISVEPKANSRAPENRAPTNVRDRLDPMPDIHQEGMYFNATLPINDLSKDARIAVTAAKKQTEISNEFRVSITIRGTFYSRPSRDVTVDQKLHLFIEGETKEEVRSAFNALNEIVDDVASLKQGGRYAVL